ncbi:MAG: hypothetical protein V3V96_10765 [Acidiferrobacterales bacterium]
MYTLFVNFGEEPRKLADAIKGLKAVGRPYRLELLEGEDDDFSRHILRIADS